MHLYLHNRHFCALSQNFCGISGSLINSCSLWLNGLGFQRGMLHLRIANDDLCALHGNITTTKIKIVCNNGQCT